MVEWLRKTCCSGPEKPFVRGWLLWLDNASRHAGHEVQHDGRVLRTRVRFLPPNTTDIVAPAERFSIQLRKVHWRRLC